MRKIKSLLLIAFAVVLLGSAQVKAANEVVAIDGASIRTATEELGQGLRFYAKLDESVKENEHGFYIAYGIATPAELEVAIALAAGGDVMLNGKVVYQTVVPGVTAENEYSVVLLGIPEVGYFDAITVLPYVVIDEDIVLPEVVVTRSVGEVALNMASAGENPPEAVLNAVKTSYKRVGLNAKGQLEITDDLYELNHFHLREEFIKDWNLKFVDANLANLAAADFFASAKAGSPDATGSNKNLAPTNIYKFFNDEVYGVRWGWLLNYITSVDGTTHPSRQIVAIKGDGTNGDYLLYNADQLSHSIANFFNQEHEIGNYSAINFTELHRYEGLKTHNNKVYINLNNYEFYSVGNQVTVAAAPERVGYNFVHYKVGLAEVLPGQYTITQDNVVFESVYSPINYNVTFFDGVTELTTLAKTYNIEGSIVLGSYVKEGYTFLGWYDNALFDGSEITSIPSGSTGHKVYYAKTVEAANAPVPITYNLDGGNFYKYESREAMVADFMLDFNAYFFDKDDIVASGFQAGTYQWNVYTFFTAETYAAKWGWMRTYMIQIATDQSHASAATLQSNDDATWRGSIDSFLNETVRDKWPASADYSVEPAKNGFWHLLVNDVAEEYEYATTLVLPIPVKFGSTFAGWYYEADFSGTVVTQIVEATTETIVLYAKWQ